MTENIKRMIANLILFILIILLLSLIMLKSYSFNRVEINDISTDESSSISINLALEDIATNLIRILNYVNMLKQMMLK